MKINLSFTLLLLLLLSFEGIFGQRMKLKLADKYFEKQDYSNSLTLYEEVSKSKKKNHQSLHRTALCYNLLGNKVESEKWYNQLIIFGTDNPLVYYEYSKILRSNEKYSDADKNLNIYLQKSKQNQLSISESYYSDLKKDSSFRVVSNEDFNSSSYDFAPSIIGENYYFVSGRLGNSDIFDSTELFRIYKFSGSESNSQTPTLFHETSSLIPQEGPIAYNKLTKQYFITSNRIFGDFKTNQLKLFILDESKSWETAISFPFNSEEYSVGHAAFSNDGKTLFFVSNMIGGEGDSDIWYSQYENGNWSKPTNMGKTINTRDKELFPYINAKGDLFFSSEGHLGLGGLDIFKAEMLNNTYTDPKNLGYPINTNFDDVSLVEIPNSSFAFFSSNRPNGKGKDDIYKIEFKNKDTKKIEPEILSVKELVKTNEVKITETISTITAAKEQEIITKTIFFEYNSIIISESDKEYLNKIAIGLKANKQSNLIINGYADSKGTNELNQQLSSNRAKQVYNYLKSKGVSSSQLTYKGFGEGNLTNKCADDVECTDEEHRQNRRVEFVIMNK